MMKSESESYKAAGVDITAGYASVELMKKHVASTMRPEVVGGIGGFSGGFSLAASAVCLRWTRRAWKSRCSFPARMASARS